MTYTWHARTEWATRTPKFATLAFPVRDVFWHHDVFRYQKSWDPAVMRALEEAEISRGGYIALAYHLHILGDGTQVEDRPSTVKGGATIYNNDTSLAICVPGNYRDNDTLTLAQVDSVGAAIATWIKHGRAQRDYRLRPHSDVFATACPSDQVRWWIANGMHQVIERHLAQSIPIPQPSPPVPPPDWDGIRLAVIARAKIEVAIGPILKYQLPMMRGEEVRWWQHALNVASNAGIEADGYFGTQTAQRTKNWQAFWKIAADGIVGPQSRKTMLYHLSRL